MGTEINWFEIHVLDLDRAEAFYKKIFNASFFEMKDYPYDARGITLNELLNPWKEHGQAPIEKALP